MDLLLIAEEGSQNFTKGNQSHLHHFQGLQALKIYQRKQAHIEGI